VSIHDAYTHWHEHEFKKKLDQSLALPVLHALQGHPKSGKLWEKHITAILQSPQFGFKSTTHDRSIHSATFEGTKILLLRQDDDFAVACPNEELAKHLCNQIGKCLQLPSEDTHPFKCLGLLKDLMDSMSHNILTRSSSHAKSTSSESSPPMDGRNLPLLYKQSLLCLCHYQLTR